LAACFPQAIERDTEARRQKLPRAGGDCTLGGMVRKLVPLLVVGAFALVLLSLIRRADARSSVDITYHYDDLWPIALRYVRVDLNAPIKDKDKDGGYVMFEMTDDDGKTYDCHLELARVRDFAGRDAVRATVDLGGLPLYREAEVLQGIQTKASNELGMPAAPSDPDAGQPVPDGGRPSTPPTYPGYPGYPAP
jgi:hypothetical protein